MCPFYFYNNFGKCRPILIIFHCVFSESVMNYRSSYHLTWYSLCYRITLQIVMMRYIHKQPLNFFS